MLKRHILPVLAYPFLLGLRSTWRCHETGGEHLDQALATGRSLVAAFLHGRSIMLLALWGGGRRGRWMIMCSNSLDGDGMARIERWMGFQVVRGSSGSGGREAFMAMIRGVRRDPGLGTCLTIDGSRGPRGHAQGGTIALAQRTGGMILPVTVSARPAVIFRKSWDRSLLAWPFARVHLVWGEPLHVPRRLEEAEFERLRAQLEERLIALQAQADQLSGFSDVEPVRAPVAARPVNPADVADTA